MDNKGEIVIYQTKDGKTNLDVKIEKDTVWLTQKQIAALFKKGVPGVNEHIKNIYKEGELDESSTIRNFRIVQREGGRDTEREVSHYSLDVVISVGYRVHSKEGTQFRIWATNVLKDYLVKGFAVNLKRLTELEKRFESHKESFEHFRYHINKFFINTAHRDVLNAVIDDMDRLKGDFKTFLENYDKLKDKLK